MLPPESNPPDAPRSPESQPPDPRQSDLPSPQSLPAESPQPNLPVGELGESYFFQSVDGQQVDGQQVDGQENGATGEAESFDQEPVLAEQVFPGDGGSATSSGSMASGAELPCTEGPGNPQHAGTESTSRRRANDARARWWSPLAIAGLSLACFVFTSALMAMLALFIVHGEISPEVLRGPEPMQKVSQSRLGLFIVIVIPQIALVIPCIVAAMLSPIPFRQRLGLVRGNWPVWTWPAVAAATPLVGMVSGLVVGLFLDESDALKQMTEIFRGHGRNGFFIPLALMIGATPAICEEFLFRGYIQRRLTRSLGPVLGVGIASFLFAAFHLDLVHVIAVFPLGLFLGWVSWQSGSLFPAMLGHFVNNVISVVGIVVAPEETPDVLALPAVALTLGIFALGLMGMAVVSVVSILYRRTESADLSAGEAQLA